MRRRRAFTLVELLVVIAIIMILIAILLPVCIKIRNRALVLACPIAYIGEDGGVYLTDPRGGHSLKISESGVKAQMSVWQWAPLSWSPCGRRLAYIGYDPRTNWYATFFHEPSAGKSWVVRGLVFSGWIDYDTCLDDAVNIAKVETGARIGVIVPRQYHTLIPTPLGSDAPYIAAVHTSSPTTIAWVGHDFHRGKTLWSNPDKWDYADHPKIDPLCEYVAWDEWGNNKTWVKPIKENSAVRPTLLSGAFCDWTEDGNVLTNIGGALAVYNRDGRLLRTLNPPVKPMRDFVGSYRKYGHR